ncbi:MAG: cyclase family protein [Chloroflexota bacterium]
MPFVDLAHDLYDGMPGFKFKDDAGQIIQYTAHVKSFLTHEESNPKFKGLAEFEITELNMHTSIGTYLDAPFHRFRDGRDVSQLRLDELILEGVCIDARNMSSWQAFDLNQLPDVDMVGKAVLFCFGWDTHWGDETYFSYPFLSLEVLRELIRRGVSMVGVDTVNIDDSRDLNRPAHTLLLRDEIFIVENLTNLEPLIGKSFRFFAVPIKVRGGAAMNIRAFAEL